MSNAPHNASVERRRAWVFATGFVCLWLAMVWMAASYSPQLLIRHQYHEIAAAEETIRKNIGVSFSLERNDAFQRQSLARDQLVTLGALKEVQLQLQYLSVSDARHLIQLHRPRFTLDAMLAIQTNGNPDRSTTFRLTGRNKDVDRFSLILKAHDVPDYRERIRKPDLIAKVQRFLRELPDSEQPVTDVLGALDFDVDEIQEGICETFLVPISDPECLLCLLIINQELRSGAMW